MLNNIKNIITNHQSLPKENTKITAVLLPLFDIDGEIHILFEKRSLALNNQPGEICLPGGKRENDELPIISALRETTEELNIKESQIEIFGGISPIITPFNLVIYPFIGKIHLNSIEDINYNKDEVDHIFLVPLQYFIDHKPTVYKIKNKMGFPDDFPFDRIPNGKDYNWKEGYYIISFYEYEEYVIWGITAKIINNFIDIIKGLS